MPSSKPVDAEEGLTESRSESNGVVYETTREPTFGGRDVEGLNHGGMGTSESQDGQIGILRGTLLGVCLATVIFLQASNISILTTVSSAIAAEFDAYENVSWLTSSYLIAMSSLTPVGGKLCKIFSSAACILTASVLISLGGLVSSLAKTLAWFLVGRVISGIGAAFIFGVATVFVIELVSEKRRGLFVGLLNSGYTVGVATGAVIAGALEAGIGWRAIFWLQIPLSLAAGLGIYFSVPPTKSDRENADQSFKDGLKRIDYAGVVTMASFLVLLLYSLSAHTINSWTLLASAIALLAFLTVEARFATEPIIPIEVMTSRGVAFSCLAALGFMMSRWSVLFYTPVYSIAVRGWSPATAGLILLPTNAGFATGGLIVGLFHIRKAQSYYFSTIICIVLFAASMFVFFRISVPRPTPGLYVATTFANGCITGAALNYSYQHVLHRSKPKLHAIVTSLVAMFRGFAGSFGASIGGGIFGRVLKSNLELGFEGQEFEGKDRLISKLLGSPLLASQLHGEQREVARDSYAAATSALFLAGCFLALIAAALQGLAGWAAVDGADESELAGEERPLLQNEE